MLEHCTPHARARMQQRAIRPEELEMLLDFGSERHTHERGREIFFWDKKARARLAKRNPAAARAAERMKRTYAVVGSNGVIITIGYRYKRIPRD
jgi:hypothetical protein